VAAGRKHARDEAQRLAVVLDVLEHVPQDHAAVRSLDVGKRPALDADLRVAAQRRRGARDRGLRKVDCRAAPAFRGKVRSDVAVAAAHLEERTLQRVLLDEAVEAEQHVRLQRQEVRHRGSRRRGRAAPSGRGFGGGGVREAVRVELAGGRPCATKSRRAASIIAGPPQAYTW
jgi:hypothetical protein